MLTTIFVGKALEIMLSPRKIYEICCILGCILVNIASKVFENVMF